MYELKVIAHSASKKSVLASITKKIGLFASSVIGNIAIAEGEEIPAVGSLIPLEGVTKVTTRESIAENGEVFNWLVLE